MDNNDTTPHPQPVKHSSRNSFGIDYYATEEEAEEAVRLAAGEVAVNGGWYDGQRTCRDPGGDKPGLFAVIVP